MEVKCTNFPSLQAAPALIVTVLSGQEDVVHVILGLPGETKEDMIWQWNSGVLKTLEAPYRHLRVARGGITCVADESKKRDSNTEFIRNFVVEYEKRDGIHTKWEKPVVGFV